MKEVKEIDFLIDYIQEIRKKFVAEIREKERELGVGMEDVANRLCSGMVDLENKELDHLKNRLNKL